MLPVDWLVNCTVSGASPVAGLMAKAATGAVGLVTFICRETFDVPPGPFTVSVIVYKPGEPYVWRGLISELFEPSPKFHESDVITPLDWLVNCAVNGASPPVGLRLNAAIGRGTCGVGDGTGVGIRFCTVMFGLTVVNTVPSRR